MTSKGFIMSRRAPISQAFYIDTLNQGSYTRLFEAFRSYCAANDLVENMRTQGVVEGQFKQKHALSKERFYEALHRAVHERDLRTAMPVDPPYADHYEPYVTRFIDDPNRHADASLPPGIDTACEMIKELILRLDSFRHTER